MVSEEKCGTDVLPLQVHTMDGEEARKICVLRMRAEHNLKSGKGDEEEESDEDEEGEGSFDRERAEKRAKKLVPDSGATYIYGVTYVPAPIRSDLGAFLPVDMSDGCHMDGPTKGTMLTTATLDSDHHLNTVATSIFLDNESERVWDKHNEFVQEAYGKDDYDTTARRCIIDGDKEATASFKRIWPGKMVFMWLPSQVRDDVKCRKGSRCTVCQAFEVT